MVLSRGWRGTLKRLARYFEEIWWYFEDTWRSTLKMVVWQFEDGSVVV